MLTSWDNDTIKREVLSTFNLALILIYFTINVNAQKDLLEKSRLLFCDSSSKIKIITFNKKVKKTLRKGGWPRFSSKGKNIAFYHEGDIFIMDTKGKILDKLTNHPKADMEPFWSPDGKQIVFVSNRDNEWGEIYIINIKTKILKRLTFNELSEFSPCWSPDKKKIVYAAGKGFGKNIYIMDSDGKDQKDITPNEILMCVPGFTFTADGNRVFFAGVKRVGGGTAIYTMRLDGKDLEQITQETGDIDNSPVLSPDGNMIAYSSGKDTYIMNLLTEKEELFLKEGSVFSWVWPASAYGVSPKGKIAYMWGEIKK